MQTPTLAQTLKALFVKDPAARQRLEKKLGSRGLVHALLEEGVHHQLVGRCLTALREEGIDPAVFVFQRIKRELWKGDDLLPDIQSQQELGQAVTELKARYTSIAITRRVGLASREALQKACRRDAFPRPDTVKAMMETVLEDRMGGLVKRKSDEKPAPKSGPGDNPWMRLKARAKRDPKRYGSNAVGKRLGVSGQVIRHRWERPFNPEDPLAQKLLEAYPVLASQEASGDTTGGPASAPSAREDGNIRATDLVSAALAALHAHVEVIARLGQMNALTDGDRMIVWREVQKLLKKIGLDEAAFARMSRVEPITDGLLAELVQGLGPQGGRQ